MTKIGGSGRPPADPKLQPSTTEKAQAEKPAAGMDKPAAAGGEKKVLDAFERAGLPQRLEAIAGKKTTLGPVQFTNQHLAQVAEQFAVMLRKNPTADRKTRAKMFAKAILRSQKFGRIFDEADEKDLESLYDAIASQLDSSPGLAQLVDEVTDWSLRSPIGR